MDDLGLLNRFFSAWSETDAEARKAAVADCFAEDGVYADPHVPTPFTGVDAVSEMLGQFRSGMPDASVTVIEEPDSHNNFCRCFVSFQNGETEFMRGQYFFQINADNKLSQVVGFAGTGNAA